MNMHVYLLQAPPADGGSDDEEFAGFTVKAGKVASSLHRTIKKRNAPVIKQLSTVEKSSTVGKNGIRVVVLPKYTVRPLIQGAPNPKT